MSGQLWSQALWSADRDGAALANTTTATTLLNAQSKFTLPGNFLYYPGQVLRFTAQGRVSNIVTTPGTLTLDIRFGGTIVFNGGAITLNTTAKTNVTWRMVASLVVRAIGSAGNVMGMGQWSSESVVSSPAGTAGDFSLPASAPAVGTNFDTTTAQQIDMFGAWSIANSGNSIQLHQFIVESLN